MILSIHFPRLAIADLVLQNLAENCHVDSRHGVKELPIDGDSRCY